MYNKSDYQHSNSIKIKIHRMLLYVRLTHSSICFYIFKSHWTHKSVRHVLFNEKKMWRNWLFMQYPIVIWLCSDILIFPAENKVTKSINSDRSEIKVENTVTNLNLKATKVYKENDPFYINLDHMLFTRVQKAPL